MDTAQNVKSKKGGTVRRTGVAVIDTVIRGIGPGLPLEVDFGGLHAIASPSQGVVSLTFDDGYEAHFDVAAPLMAERGFAGTAYVMPDQVGLDGYMTLDELRVLRRSYGWDVAAHHFVPFTKLEPDDLDDTILGVRGYLTRHGFGDGANHLAYPLGKLDPKVVLPTTRRHFGTARLASAGPETLPPGDPHRLRAMNVLDTTSPAEIRAALLRAREHREWLILMFHFLVEEPEIETAYAISAFTAALDEIRNVGLPVRTVNEVWKAYATPPAARP